MGETSRTLDDRNHMTRLARRRFVHAWPPKGTRQVGLRHCTKVACTVQAGPVAMRSAACLLRAGGVARGTPTRPLATLTHLERFSARTAISLPSPTFPACLVQSRHRTESGIVVLFSRWNAPFCFCIPPSPFPATIISAFLILPSAAGCDLGKNKGNDLAFPC